MKELEFNIKGSEVWQGEADGGDLIGFAFPKILVLCVPPPNNPTIHPLPYKQCYHAKDESDTLSRAPVNLQSQPRFFKLEQPTPPSSSSGFSLLSWRAVFPEAVFLLNNLPFLTLYQGLSGLHNCTLSQEVLFPTSVLINIKSIIFFSRKLVFNLSCQRKWASLPSPFCYPPSRLLSQQFYCF